MYPELAAPAGISLLDLPLTSFKPQRYRPGHLGTWSGHVAFAHDLIAALIPSLVVELGTHWGESYFALCQSIFENGLDCRSYAVDHWLGDTHSGLYGDEVFENVKRYNDTHYGQFSRLLRTSFDDALDRFGDESIDLLHIDGFHTYRAVSHDFRSWLPKVKPGGIILLHDIEARHADFGVWRLWAEIKQDFSDTFEFHHCWGLGVLRKRANDFNDSALLNTLFHGPVEIQERIRRHYFLYASHLEATLRTAETAVQIYPFGENGYREETSLTQHIDIDRSERLSFYLPHGLGNGPVRIDPAACPCVIDIARIAVRDIASGTVLWEADDPARLLSAVTVSGSAALLSNFRLGVLVSYGNDPRIILPAIEHYERPVGIDISLRINTSYEAVYEALQMQAREQIERLDLELAAARATNDELTAELRQSQSERMLMSFEMKQAIFDRHAAERELKRVEAECMEIESVRRDLGIARAQLESKGQNLDLAGQQLQSARQEAEAKRMEMESARQDLAIARRQIESKDQNLELAGRQLLSARNEAEIASRRVGRLEADFASLAAALNTETLTRTAVMRSVSWRVTEPARRFMAILRTATHRR